MYRYTVSTIMCHNVGNVLCLKQMVVRLLYCVIYLGTRMMPSRFTIMMIVNINHAIFPAFSFSE